jgi:endoglucanase
MSTLKPTVLTLKQTYGSQWSFDSGHVTILAAAISAQIATGQSATFTFEFFPRVPGNSVSYTLTI